MIRRRTSIRAGRADFDGSVSRTARNSGCYKRGICCAEGTCHRIGVGGVKPARNYLLTKPRHNLWMSRYRRMYVPGCTYYFTVNLAERGSNLLIREIGLLRCRSPRTPNQV